MITLHEQMVIEDLIRNNLHEKFPGHTFDGYIGKVLYVKVKERIGRKLDRELKAFVSSTARSLNGEHSLDNQLRMAEGRKPREGSHASLRVKRDKPPKGSVRAFNRYHPFKGNPRNEKEKERLALLDEADHPSDEELDETRWYQADYGGLSMIAPGTPPPSPVHDLDLVGPPSNPCTAAVPLLGIKDTGMQAISPAQVRHWKAEDRKNYSQQGDVMGASAEVAARCANLDVDSAKDGWEWLHLISFQMGGIDNYPQRAENLVAGTYHANSEMIGLEEAIKKLILDHNVTFTLQVKATLIPGTHVGRGVIEYDVHYNGRKSHYEFEVRSQNRPFSGVNAIWLDQLRQDLGL